MTTRIDRDFEVGHLPRVRGATCSLFAGGKKLAEAGFDVRKEWIVAQPGEVAVRHRENAALAKKLDFTEEHEVPVNGRRRPVHWVVGAKG
jgi:hypothetical protein